MRRSKEEAAAEALARSLLQEHGAAMMAYAIRLTGDHTAAEDVVQEALVRAWRHADRLTNGKGSVRGWLFTVVRNLVYDRTRARRARPVEVGEPQQEDAVSHDHSDQVVDTIVVLEALEKLSKEHRAVLDLVYLKGKTVAEAAAELDIPQGTAKSRMFQAIRLLRHAISGNTNLARVS